MRHKTFALFLAGALCHSAQAISETNVAGPYTQDNLSIFLIHPAPAGGVKASTARYLTLQQAMEQKKVVVHETKQVNELAVENTSSEPVFIQEGDIVKGGNQDRMISNDFVLPPKSGRLPLAAFCVEQGRWSRRGNESTAAFHSSADMGEIGWDPRSTWSQMSVWKTVSEIQETLASRLRKKTSSGLAGVAAAESPTSLVLIQNSPPVVEAVSAYTAALAGVVSRNPGVVGYAFAVNGELKGAHLYASPELFSAMWPKLLKATAIEAVRLRQEKKFAPLTVSAGVAFIRESEGGAETTRDVDRRTKLVRWEGKQQLWTESRDFTSWVHRSVVKK